MENQWNHTRHLIAVHTSKSAREIMPLSLDRDSVPAPSKADRERIRNQWQHLLTPTDE